MISQEERTQIKKAYEFAQRKHAGQLDDYGYDYFNTHVKQVFLIIMFVTNDASCAIVALLHDTLEDTNTTYKEIYDNFGKRVADLVNELTHAGKKDAKGYYFPRLKSRDAILVKFADRLSNLSRMDIWDKKRQEQYLRKSKFWKSKIDKKETNFDN